MWFVAAMVAMLAGAGSVAARQYDVINKAAASARSPGISGREMKDIAEMLALSDGQKAAAQELVQAYQTSCRQLVETYTDLDAQNADSGRSTGWNDGEVEAYEDLRLVFFTTAFELHRGVLSDLRALLTKEQDAGWDKFERTHRRRSTLPWSAKSVAGGSDLIEIVKGVDPAALSNPVVADLLSGYELEMDRELVARNTKIERYLLMNEEPAGRTDSGEIPPGRKLYNEIAESRGRIGALNRRVAESLTPQFTEEKQAKFQEVVNLEFYPGVYGKRFIHRVFDAVKAMKDVDAAQQEAIKGIRERYGGEAETINTRWARTLIEIESKKTEDEMLEPRGVANQCRESRERLDARTIEDVKKILTEDQREALPSIGFCREIQLLKPQAVK